MGSGSNLVLTDTQKLNTYQQKIACASVYFKPGCKHKSDLQDHMAEAYNILSTKFQRGLHFIIAGDTNDLSLTPILNLSKTGSPQFIKNALNTASISPGIRFLWFLRRITCVVEYSPTKPGKQT